MRRIARPAVIAAQEQPMQARRLPLAEHMKVQGQGSRNAKWSVLNVEAVVHALLEFQRCGNWQRAFDVAVPLRKRRLVSRAKPC